MVPKASLEVCVTPWTCETGLSVAGDTAGRLGEGLGGAEGGERAGNSAPECRARPNQRGALNVAAESLSLRNSRVALSAPLALACQSR